MVGKLRKSEKRGPRKTLADGNLDGFNFFDRFDSAAGIMMYSWGPTIAYPGMLPDHGGTDLRAEPPRFMACMRLLRGIELDHVQELMQVPAPFWRCDRGGCKVWPDSYAYIYIWT